MKRSHTVSRILASTIAGGGPLIGQRKFAQRPLSEIDGWRIVRKLGSGGMGQVYLAEKPQGILSTEILHQRVALKTFHPRLDRKRIAREIRAQSIFNHPNLIHYLGHGTYKGLLYLLMNYVEGSDAWRMAFTDEASESPQPFPLAESCAIAVEVAKGLSHIHGKTGFVHRDVKPANILVSDEGSVILGDLGLAELSGGKNGGGTPGFVAPEQARGEDTDSRADVYSLGCTLYFLLTGEPPFPGTSFNETDGLLKAHLDPELAAQGLEPHLGEVAPGLAHCLASMLAKDRDARPSCPEVILQLRPFTTETDICGLFNERRSGPQTLPGTISAEQLPVAARQMDRRSVLYGLSAVSTAVAVPFVMGRLKTARPFEQLAPNKLDVPGSYRLLNVQPTVLRGNKSRWGEPEFQENQLVIHAGDFCMVQLGTLDMAFTPNFRFEFDLDIRGSWNGSVGLFFGCEKNGDILGYHVIEISDNASPIIKPAMVYRVVESDLAQRQDKTRVKIDEVRNLDLPNFNFTRRCATEANHTTYLQRISLMPRLDRELRPPDGDVPRGLSGGFGVFSRNVNAVFTNATIQFSN